MRKHIKADEPFERSEVTAGEAIERYLQARTSPTRSS